ncbi:uncharacterized protein LOC133188936 [Saccostrea echinata]|uniref:uncharacterized protein LOC133188936 n=1 Tax=Saccostrea echinata TaxID=191078 RepID=UPI002A7ECDFB|nr:uncharacterized protein LOC133188936 [Saccostrea echinata]
MPEELSEIPESYLPTNVHLLHKEKREKIFHQTMDKILDKILVRFWDLEDDQSSLILDLKVNIQSNEFLIQAPVQNGYAKLNLRKGKENRITIIQIPIALLTIGKSVQLTVNGVIVTATRINKETDDIQNYSLCFLQYVFLIWNFMDAIKEGDILRTNVCLKTMIPLFYCHSELSKYLAECIDYIQKTEILLSTKMSMKVRASSFINKSGRTGKNKPADIEKENQVKLLKELIRGLGSNKTENAIIGISKAAPVIESVVHQFDEEAGICELRTTHKSRSLENDLMVMLEKTRELDPFSNQGRSLHSFKGINANPVYTVNKEKFQ